ncbi:hypothetical protein CHUAL_010298 [Chamberlinius hualienensis]
MGHNLASAFSFIFIFIIGWICFAYGQVPHKRFEYKYSFKGPYLAQKDGSVPFWTYGGSAIANEDMVRITPSLRSKKGFIWTKNTTTFDWWEVEMVFRVTGRGRIGADGLAFWFTSQPGEEGPVFGSSDRWLGLGVFFDSFDNDNKHNNPYIMAVINDGQMSYDHQNDGINQQLAGCLRDYRNKPFPVRAKIEYYRNSLTLLFHNGMTDSEQDYEICFRAENVFLPNRGHFGISAATGGLADDHDILKLLASSMLSTEDHQKLLQQPAIADSEKEKLAREFEEYRVKLEAQKDEYQKQHPDQGKEASQDEYFEREQEELKQIYLGQSRMFELIRELHRKMDEIIGRQERTLSLVTSSQGGTVGGGSSGGALPAIDSIRRHEVDTILNNQRDVVNTIREIRSFVSEIHKKGATAGGIDFQNLGNELKDGLNIVKRDVSQMNAAKPACPSTSCLSTTIFITFVAIQLILTLGYLIYRDNREAQAKKFY